MFRIFVWGASTQGTHLVAPDSVVTLCIVCIWVFILYRTYTQINLLSSLLNMEFFIKYALCAIWNIVGLQMKCFGNPKKLFHAYVAYAVRVLYVAYWLGSLNLFFVWSSFHLYCPIGIQLTQHSTNHKIPLSFSIRASARLGNHINMNILWASLQYFSRARRE